MPTVGMYYSLRKMGANISKSKSICEDEGKCNFIYDSRTSNTSSRPGDIEEICNDNLRLGNEVYMNREMM